MVMETIRRTSKSIYSEMSPSTRVSSTVSLPQVELISSQLKEVLFTNTNQCFHSQICQLVLSALSRMLESLSGGGGGQERSQLFLQLSPEGRRRQWLGEQIIIRFSSFLFCHPTIKNLDLSNLSLHHPQLTRAVCASLPDIPNLTKLNMAHWQCRRNNLLGESVSQQAGLVLMFLPKLTSVCLTDVSLAFIRNLAIFCPQLLRLELTKSEVNDESATYISSMKKLEVVQLKETPDIKEIGFAEILRNLPKLKSLGQCNYFGAAINTLYSKWSLYQRSVGSIPEVLALQEVECDGPVTDYELEMVREHCPELRSLKLKYSQGKESFSHQSPGLFNLIRLTRLEKLGVISTDFYSHSLFSVIQTSGAHLTSLSLYNVDEMNLSSLLMIGSHCPNLLSLVLSCCHYTPDQSDRTRLESICNPTTRLQGPETHFLKLKRASFVILSSIHLPVIKYPLFFARNLEELHIQIYQPLEDSFIAALVSWNPMTELKKFILTRAPNLTLMAANILIQACPNLEYIGQVTTWGAVERGQLESINREIRARNMDLVIE